MLLPSSARRSRLTRPLACALAALALLGPLLASHHEATVRHVRCPEHGELIEARAASNAEPPERGSGSFSDDADGGGSNHDRHCPLALRARQQSMAPEACPAQAQPLAADSNPAAPPEGREHAQEPLYRLAPKGSPPAGA